MFEKLKNIVIGIVVLIFIVVSVNYATDGPGSGLDDGSGWRLTSDYVGSLANFWCKWVEIHFGSGVDAKLREGEEAGSNIIYIDRTEGRSDDVKSNGYGLYQMDLRKHMAGYLYYVSSNARTASKSSIIKEQMQFEEEGGRGTPETLKLTEACKYVADKLITTAYSEKTVKEYLSKVLNDINTILGAEEVKKLQSDFWYKVYGQNAYKLLTNSLDFNVPNSVKGKVQGAVLSIMEDRYRNKTLKDKTKMELKVEKGDLWPFLVYTETEDNGAHTLWKYKEKEEDKTYKTVTWEKMLEGAYQYMVYYEYKVDEDADSTDYITLYNGAKAEIFKSEYEELFGYSLRELKGEELDNFYQRIRKIRRYYKKSKDNSGGIFGEEEYDQSSDVSYSEAINALKAKIKDNDVFKGLDPENIARTYMMAKNIASNTRMIEQNAQYDIGSNIISRTPGGYDDEVLLTDLQLITLERDPSTGKYTDDADKDGLTDGYELGSDEGTYIDTDITGFVRQMLAAEGGEENADYLLSQYIQNIKNAEGNPEKENKIAAQRDLHVEGDKIKVSLMSYKSNPIFKDTDFDGVWDGYGYDSDGNAINQNVYKDTKPLDSTIEGQMLSSNHVGTVGAKTHMDYRYFFLDRFNYYDELSTMSLLLSNAMYERGSGISSIDGIMKKIGLDNYVIKNPTGDVGEDIFGISDVQYSVEYATGTKEVEYSKNNTTDEDSYIRKTIIPIVIKVPDSISLSKSYSEIGRPKWVEKCDSGDESHNVKSYEVYAELIKDNLWRYLNDKTDVDQNSKNIVYWITGHKEAGAIANVLASKYIDEGHEVYCYTFGSPMTLYNNPDEDKYSVTGYRARYDCIFNVVNEDDAYCFLMPQTLGFSRYGLSCYASGRKILKNGTLINEYLGTSESSHKIVDSIVKLYKNKTRTREETYEKKAYGSISKFIESLMLEAFNYRLNAKINRNELINDYKKYPELQSIINSFIENIDKLVDAGGTDVYYYLAKNMQNADIVNTVNFYDNKRVEEISGVGLQGLMCEALEVMGQQYVQNVKTYGTNTYSLESVSKDIDKAYKKNQYNTLHDLGIAEQKEAIKDKFNSLINNHNWFRCGDDCVRFMFSVIYYALNGDLGDKLSDASSGQYYTDFGTNILTTSDNDDLFIDLGFEIHYIGEEDSNGHKFGYEDLEDGDILVAYSTDTKKSSGHVEIYIGTKYEENKSFDWSFGWGSLKPRYPSNGVFGKNTKIDNSKSDEKKYYLLDNFTNLTYDKNKDGIVPDFDYELRYFKVFRMKDGE